MRALVRDLSNKKILKDVDYVLVGRRDTGSCAYKDLQSSAAFALQKVNSILIKQKENEKTSDCIG